MSHYIILHYITLDYITPNHRRGPAAPLQYITLHDTKPSSWARSAREGTRPPRGGGCAHHPQPKKEIYKHKEARAIKGDALCPILVLFRSSAATANNGASFPLPPSTPPQKEGRWRDTAHTHPASSSAARSRQRGMSELCTAYREMMQCNVM